jgi:hypothetical protein
MLGNWLTSIAREERKIIFVGAQLLFGQFGVHIIILFLRKKQYTSFLQATFRGNILAAVLDVAAA